MKFVPTMKDVDFWMWTTSYSRFLESSHKKLSKIWIPYQIGQAIKKDTKTSIKLEPELWTHISMERKNIGDFFSCPNKLTKILKTEI